MYSENLINNSAKRDACVNPVSSHNDLNLFPVISLSPGLNKVEEISGDLPPADRHSRPLRAKVLLHATLSHTAFPWLVRIVI